MKTLSSFLLFALVCLWEHLCCRHALSPPGNPHHRKKCEPHRQGAPKLPGALTAANPESSRTLQPSSSSDRTGPPKYDRRVTQRRQKRPIYKVLCNQEFLSVGSSHDKKGQEHKAGYAHPHFASCCRGFDLPSRFLLGAEFPAGPLQLTKDRVYRSSSGRR